MKNDSEDRIGRLLLTLSVHAPQMDLQQISGLLYDLQRQCFNEERQRVLQLVEVFDRRVFGSKGRSWQQELKEMRDGIDNGVQTMPL